MRTNSERQLAGKSILVTGGSSGVGLEVAKQAAELGANLVLVGSDPNKLQQAAELLPKNQCIVFACDVRNSASAEQAVDAGRAAYSQAISVLVNCAGTILRQPATDTSDDDWNQIMQVNVNGVFYFSRAFAKQTDLSSGAIINVSSTCGQVGAAGLAAYCASKGAVDQLTRSMALELGARKITVNAVAPGAINSPMLYSKHAVEVSSDLVRKNNIESIPIGAIAEAEEVARTILFIARQGHMTGSIVALDGGYTAK